LGTLLQQQEVILLPNSRISNSARVQGFFLPKFGDKIKSSTTDFVYFPQNGRARATIKSVFYRGRGKSHSSYCSTIAPPPPPRPFDIGKCYKNSVVQRRKTSKCAILNLCSFFDERVAMEYVFSVRFPCPFSISHTEKRHGKRTLKTHSLARDSKTQIQDPSVIVPLVKELFPQATFLLQLGFLRYGDLFRLLPKGPFFYLERKARTSDQPPELN
jgi:hypothetical protein